VRKASDFIILYLYLIVFFHTRPLTVTGVTSSDKIASGKEMAAVARLLLDHDVNINATDINGK